MVPIFNEEDFIKMNIAGEVTAEILDDLYDFIKIGISTEDINYFVHEKTIKAGGIPAPLNYKGFPKSVCTSVNDVVCHGIPNSREILKDGDILNVDVTTILNGYYGDASRMYITGKDLQDKEKYKKQKNIIRITWKALQKGIEVCKNKNANILDIGQTIQEYSEKAGFSVVRDFCGHGICRKFHQPPEVLHYLPEKIFRKRLSCKLKAGMIFTIEPMINTGEYQCTIDKNDGWTARTKDGSLSAQFEETIGILNNDVKIFTESRRNINPMQKLGIEYK